MGTDLEVGEVTAVVNGENEKTESQTQQQLQAAVKDEITYDEGLVPWLQVLGSFFLFFNSWYVLESVCAERIYTEMLTRQGSYKHLGCLPNILRTKTAVAHVIVGHSMDRVPASVSAHAVRGGDRPIVRRRLLPVAAHVR